MKRTQILAITGIGAGVVGSVAGAIATRKMYKGNKKSIESGELNDKKEIKKAKLKTGLAATGTTLLAGLAIVSGVGLAMSYGKENENYDTEVKYFNDPDEEASNEEWLTAMSEHSELVDELIMNSLEQTEGLMTIKDEVDEFVSNMKLDKTMEEYEEILIDDVEKIMDRAYDILDDAEKSIDKAYDEIDNANRNISVVQGIIEQDM